MKTETLNAKALRSNSKQVRNAVKNHLINSIELSGYDVKDSAPLKQKLSLIAEMIKENAFSDYELRVNKSYQKAFVSYMSGVPGFLQLEVYYYAIKEHLKNWGLTKDLTDSKAWDLYFYLCYVELIKLMNENGVNFPR